MRLSGRDTISARPIQRLGVFERARAARQSAADQGVKRRRGQPFPTGPSHHHQVIGLANQHLRVGDGGPAALALLAELVG